MVQAHNIKRRFNEICLKVWLSFVLCVILLSLSLYSQSRNACRARLAYDIASHKALQNKWLYVNHSISKTFRKSVPSSSRHVSSRLWLFEGLRIEKNLTQSFRFFECICRGGSVFDNANRVYVYWGLKRSYSNILGQTV